MTNKKPSLRRDLSPGSFTPAPRPVASGSASPLLLCPTSLPPPHGRGVVFPKTRCGHVIVLARNMSVASSWSWGKADSVEAAKPGGHTSPAGQGLSTDLLVRLHWNPIGFVPLFFLRVSFGREIVGSPYQEALDAVVPSSLQPLTDRTPCLAPELPLRNLGSSLLPHTRWLHLLRSVLGSCLSSSPEFSEAPFCVSHSSVEL